MGRNRINFVTQQELINNNVKVLFDSNNQPVIKQTHDKATKRWSETRKLTVINTSHKYGNDKSYLFVNLMIDGCTKQFPVAYVVWTYLNGDIPKGYEVDHINGDGLDNSLNNLQLLTITENAKQRRFSGANQYINSTTHDFETFMKQKEERKLQKMQEKQNRLKQRTEKAMQLQECENNILDIKQRIAEKELELKQLKQDWHDEVAKRDSIRKGIA